MEREDDPERETAIARAIAIMEWEGPAIPGANPEGRVIDERHPDTHPLAKVVLKRDKRQTDSVAAPIFHPEDPAMLDSLDIKRRTAMEGKE